MVRRVLASYFSEDKLVDTLTEFKMKGYTSEDFLIFTAEVDVNSIHAHTDEFLERLPTIRRDLNSGTVVEEIKKSFAEGSGTKPPFISLDKLIELGISREEASVYGIEADDGNILVLVEEKEAKNKSETHLEPKEQIDEIDYRDEKRK